VLVGECLQIIIRFFRHEVAKKRQGNRGNVENNVKILAISGPGQRQKGVDRNATDRKNTRPRIRMKMLAKQIERELERETAKIGHCAIYEDQLQRIWPLNTENRKGKIEQFAKQHGFKLSFYKPRLCAIFEKDSPRKRQ
jgi:hypothetical protein